MQLLFYKQMLVA